MIRTSRRETLFAITVWRRITKLFLESTIHNQLKSSFPERLSHLFDDYSVLMHRTRCVEVHSMHEK